MKFYTTKARNLSANTMMVISGDAVFACIMDRTHGRKASSERHISKCTLFNEWLDGHKKYAECWKNVESRYNKKMVLSHFI